MYRIERFAENLVRMKMLWKRKWMIPYLKVRQTTTKQISTLTCPSPWKHCWTIWWWNAMTGRMQWGSTIKSCIQVWRRLVWNEWPTDRIGCSETTIEKLQAKNHNAFNIVLDELFVFIPTAFWWVRVITEDYSSPWWLITRCPWMRTR